MQLYHIILLIEAIKTTCCWKTAPRLFNKSRHTDIYTAWNSATNIIDEKTLPLFNILMKVILHIQKPKFDDH